tara:strand:- start:400 stop:681 length:282 start_codon:yes stop_codon:yes gene_type:complete
MDAIEAEDDIERMLWTAEACVREASAETKKAIEMYQVSTQRTMMYTKVIETLKKIQQFEVGIKRNRENDNDEDYVPTQPNKPEKNKRAHLHPS